MNGSKEDIPNGYDIFISHNRADKDWVRELSSRLSAEEYNGRYLRPWLDEKFLDPGELSQLSELTTAMDRSRTLAIVLSADSVASDWVQFELDYFLEERHLDEIISILKAPCAVPKVLGDQPPINFMDPEKFEDRFNELVADLCPPGELGVKDVHQRIDLAWERAVEADQGGLDPDPTPERDALLAELTCYDIGHPATEGLAIATFLRAAGHLKRLNQSHHGAVYNLKMLLGECLAVALLRDPRYRQVAQRLIDREDPVDPDPLLSFVVVRASSKLAELDPSLVDLSVLLRVAANLDTEQHLTNQKGVVAMLLGRVAGKVRGTDVGDLMIQTLSEGGTAGRIAAIGGITIGEESAPSVFFVSELEAKHLERQGPAAGSAFPPSRKLQALLFGIDLHQEDEVRRRLEIAKKDLERDFDITDLPYGYTWFEQRNLPPADHPHKAPFIGTVEKVCTADMEEAAGRLDVSNVVCFTELRVVDALFDKCGALILPLQDPESPQCRRLRSRGVPFAMLDDERMADLSNGDQIMVSPNRVKTVTHARARSSG